MKHFRLIQSGALSALSNMALDEEIFKRYLADGVGVLRLYRWQAPSFTYGFSQLPQNQINLAACATDGVGVARRITGGGILFHDDEITSSGRRRSVPGGISSGVRNRTRLLMMEFPGCASGVQNCLSA